VDHEEDTSNFDTFECSSEAAGAECGKSNARTAASPAFYEFTFRHFFDYDGRGCPSLRQRRTPLAPLVEANGGSVNGAVTGGDSDDSLVV
jgi:hypothetical protein